MKTEEHKFLWEMAQYAKSHEGMLLRREFLGRTHPYKWRCSERHIFYAEYLDLKDEKHFCKKCID